MSCHVMTCNHATSSSSSSSSSFDVSGGASFLRHRRRLRHFRSPFSTLLFALPLFAAWGLLLSSLSLLTTPISGSAFENDAETPEAVFTNEFVIEVPGGEEVARRVAAEHGLRFEGRVHEDLGDFYSVFHDEKEVDAERRRVRRSSGGGGGDISAAEEHLHRLRRDERLTFVQRQRELQREKRGYLPRHLLVDDDDDALEEDKKEEDEAHERDRWTEFERDAFEFERRLPGEYYRPEKKKKATEGEEEEEKRGVDDKKSKVCPKHNDVCWEDQWYLCNTGQTGGNVSFDLNVAPAWAKGYTGKGVVVCVMDDGVDHTHQDLKKNFDFKASWDANGNRKRNGNDPAPRTEDPSNNHGTKCAGEIAMQADNGVCGVGVAPDAGVGGIRILDGRITDRLEAKAVLFKNDYVDVYSASWGPKDNGETMEAPGRLTSAALEKACSKGRGGKGNIFVWASGNGGSRGDDCGADGYVSSIYTISIGSINEHGMSTYFMEFCPSTMGVVFSGGMHDRGDFRFNDGRPRIKTVSTDIFQGCVENFQGTSAAAPLATGCVALVLQANPHLGWRDVQHIVVHSARIPNEKETKGWEINGAGHHINDKFGFGVLDCSKMVALALNWTNVPPQRICQTPDVEADLEIPPNGGVNATLVTDGCADEAEKRVDVLEHVRVHVVITHPRRGDLVIRLYSPDGTMSELISRRHKDKHANVSFTFMTVRDWGENPRGEWTLEVVNTGQQAGELKKFHLIFYGYQTPDKTPRGGVEDRARMATDVDVDEMFESEFEEHERLQLKRVAEVLGNFQAEDRAAILSAMAPSKRAFVEAVLRKSDENVEEKEEEAKKEEKGEKREEERGLNEDAEIETLRGLIDLLDESRK